MKKYQYLKQGDEIKDGDEVNLNNGKWEPCSHIDTGQMVDNFDEKYQRFRRPLSMLGPTAFMVEYTQLIRVVFDTTGMTDEQVAERALKLSKQKFNKNISSYLDVFEENSSSNPDNECPYDEQTDRHDPDNGIDLPQQQLLTKRLVCVECPVLSYGKKVFDLTVGKEYLAVEESDPMGWRITDDDGRSTCFFDISRIFKEV